MTNYEYLRQEINKMNKMEFSNFLCNIAGHIDNNHINVPEVVGDSQMTIDRFYRWLDQEHK